MSNLIYNTVAEVGARILFILCATSKKSISMLRIEVYDHIALHGKSNGFSQDNLHPANPSFASELFGKRRLVEASIRYMAMRGLVDIHYAKNGIYYSPNTETHNYILCFQSRYSQELKQSIIQISERYDSLSDSTLKKEIFTKFANQRGEIESFLVEGGQTQ